jgi:hypothetical protein
VTVPTASETAASETAASETAPSETAVAPVLHLPEEPVGRKEVWRRAVLDGTDLAAVVGADGGVGEWLWSRWRSLGAVGIDEATLRGIALGYRREVWLWLVGDRTWAQCCSGLIGRIGRRIPS